NNILFVSCVFCVVVTVISCYLIVFLKLTFSLWSINFYVTFETVGRMCHLNV
ncbi:hypothetical protein T08_15764, partial [Trichinella sp. T8]